MVATSSALALLLITGPNQGAPFRLEASSGDRRPMRASPVVEGRLAGVPAMFVLDTGAGTHTLASWLAKKARLQTRETELKSRDSAGRLLDVGIVHGVKVAIAGLGDFALEDAVAAEFPPFFEEEGIGGALSRQLLAPRGQALVLDMPAGRARVEDTASARRAATAPSHSLAEHGIGGSGVGQGLKQRAVRRKGAGGLAGGHGVWSAPGVAVKAGAAEATLEVDVMPAKSGRTCRADGLLGMDVLTRCVLAVSRIDFAAACQP